MKQKLLLLFAFLATMITGARATVVSIVGSSGGYNYLSPTVMNKNYSLVQQIYTAEEIGMVGTITHVFYYYWNSEGSGFSKEGVQLFMKQVDKAKFSSDTDMVDLTEADKVFEGTLLVRKRVGYKLLLTKLSNSTATVICSSLSTTPPKVLLELRICSTIQALPTIWCSTITMTLFALTFQTFPPIKAQRKGTLIATPSHSILKEHLQFPKTSSYTKALAQAES